MEAVRSLAEVLARTPVVHTAEPVAAHSFAEAVCCSFPAEEGTAAGNNRLERHMNLVVLRHKLALLTAGNPIRP